MNDDFVLEGKTVTGAMDYKLAAALCYLPVMMVHLLAAGAWLLTEPKESRFVRFHAVQSLILFAILFGGAMVSLLGGMLLLPTLLLVLGSILGGLVAGVSEDLGGLVMALAAGLSGLSYVGGALLGLGLSFLFMPSFLLTGVMVMSGKEGRWPVIGSLASRLAGR